MRHFYYLKYFMLGISLSLLIIFSQGKVGSIEVRADSTKPSQQDRARILTQKGHVQLQQGRSAEALQTWLEAAKIYRQLHNSEGITGSSINQSLALQTLGLYPRACNTLVQALELEGWVCSSPMQTPQASSAESVQRLQKALQKPPEVSVTVIGLHKLGDLLRLLGKPDESQVVLEKALTMAKSLTSKMPASEILLSLANTSRSQYIQARNKYQLTSEPIAKELALKTAQKSAQTALTLYRQIAADAGKEQNSTVLQAQLYHLSLFIELGQQLESESKWTPTEFQTLQSKAQPQIQPLLKHLLTAQFSQLPAIESIYARLNFANSLMQISQDSQLNSFLFPSEKDCLNAALQLAQNALQFAQTLDNQRAKSYARGASGNIYTYLGKTKLAEQYLEEALSLSQSVQAWDASFQWQQQLGRLYQQQGNLELATEAYAGAIFSLDQIRSNILSVNPDVQFSFKDRVEPVYREYMQLLASGASPNLEQLIQVNEQLQKAELENFFRCAQLNLISLSEISKTTAVPTTIYILKLKNQIEVIVRAIDGKLNHHTVALDEVRINADALTLISQTERFNEIQSQQFFRFAQGLYIQLIAPVKKYLPQSGTLVFVLDSSLQNLPLAMLHDGQNYLLEKYNISVALNSLLRQPQALTHQQLKALVAGLSQKNPFFNSPDAPKGLEPLPAVNTEVADIKKSISSVVELMNEQFTAQRFQKEVQTNDFPIVHITTHGKFSSDPDSTVLFAWDKAMNLPQLNSMLRRKSVQSSLELLVLSACSTAKGDKRSTLGIAGMATAAGARSTLATLWLVDAESTAQLMGKFYLGLSEGLSKAEALRQAQLDLLAHPVYQHPYYWAPFILVGSWL